MAKRAHILFTSSERRLFSLSDHTWIQKKFRRIKNGRLHILHVEFFNSLLPHSGPIGTNYHLVLSSCYPLFFGPRGQFASFEMLVKHVSHVNMKTTATWQLTTREKCTHFKGARTSTVITTFLSGTLRIAKYHILRALFQRF